MLSIELAKGVVRELKAEGFDVSLDSSYSGRGMFGQTTPAIVVEADVSGAVVGWAITEVMTKSDADLSDILSTVRKLRADQFGLGYIFY